MKPILFNTEMVKAILDGRKSTTRRIIKPQPESCTNVANGILAGVKADAPMYPNYGGRLIKPPYQVGDVLYVRETFCKLWKLDDNDQIIEGTENYYYAADGYNPTPFNCFPDEDGFYGDRDCPKWRPSIFMPKEAARIFLRVTGVKAERLQQIDVDGAISEGAWGGGIPHLPFSLLYEEHPNASCNAVASFAHVWDGTVKKSDLDKFGWDANPWVWVISFDRCKKEDA